MYLCSNLVSVFQASSKKKEREKLTREILAQTQDVNGDFFHTVVPRRAQILAFNLSIISPISMPENARNSAMECEKDITLIEI